MLLDMAGFLMLIVCATGVLTLFKIEHMRPLALQLGVGCITMGSLATAAGIFSPEPCVISAFLARCALWGFGALLLMWHYLMRARAHAGHLRRAGDTRAHS